MRRAVLVSLALISCYLISWVLIYAWVMEGDYSYVTEYFRLSWTGPGETPALIQLYSLAVTSLAGLILFAVFLLRKVRNGSKDHP